MKLPKFRLRTLFVMVALFSVPMAWAAYQLKWIRQRHEFLTEHPNRFPSEQQNLLLGKWTPSAPTECPWSLRLFGEGSPGLLVVLKKDQVEAELLFPETTIDVLDFSSDVHSGQDVDEKAESSDASHPLPGGGF